jgi:uncharacterized protein (TIGR03118 family)
VKVVSIVALSLLVSLCSVAQSNNYTVTPIVNNTQDVYLVNPWGLSRPVSATPHDNEWWVSDDATGYTTLYFADKTGAAALAGLVISVPSASGKGTGTPTGTAFNAANGPGPGANNFTFATLDGTISNWNAGQTPTTKGAGCYECHVSTTTIKVNNSGKKATYTGLAEATNATDNKPTYYAANNNGGVEAYDAASFKRVTLTGSFTDPKIPSSYKAYGIQTVGAQIWVTYFNGTSGGYVDAFDTNGKLKLSLASGNVDEPWGVALAPAGFGAFSNDLLVGNTTSGMIAAFNPATGAFAGYLNDAAGNPIVIDGLWGIGFGNGNSFSGPTTTLYYAAGGNTYTTGVFGAITAAN